MRSQAVVERPRCSVCGHLLTRDGRCWFSPFHGQVATETAEAEVEVNTMGVTAQLSLSEEIFERYEVPSVRVMVSGTVEVPLEVLRSISTGFEPGDAVAFAAYGHVLDVSVPYDPTKGGHKGRLVLRAEAISDIKRAES